MARLYDDIERCSVYQTDVFMLPTCDLIPAEILSGWVKKWAVFKNLCDSCNSDERDR